MIARMKALTVKNKQRKQMFSDTDIGSPPEPVVTRWGSWLEAAFYYSKNFPKIMDIVNSLSGSDILVERAKSALNSLTIRNQLLEVKRDYETLLVHINKYEKSNVTIKKMLQWTEQFRVRGWFSKYSLLFESANWSKLRSECYHDSGTSRYFSFFLCVASALSAHFQINGKKFLFIEKTSCWRSTFSSWKYWGLGYLVVYYNSSD